MVAPFASFAGNAKCRRGSQWMRSRAPVCAELWFLVDCSGRRGGLRPKGERLSPQLCHRNGGPGHSVTARCLDLTQFPSLEALGGEPAGLDKCLSSLPREGGVCSPVVG